MIGGGTYFHTMQDVDELVTHRQDKKFIIIDDDEEDVVHVNGSGYESPPPSSTPLWEPSGSWWKDFLYFSGPGMSSYMKLLIHSRVSTSVLSPPTHHIPYALA